MTNKIKLKPAGVALISAVLLIAGLSVSPSTYAATSKSAASSPAQQPALTPEQQAYKTARDKCLKKYQDEKIPRSQTHTFMSACLKENGFSKAVHLPHPSTPTPPQSSK